MSEAHTNIKLTKKNRNELSNYKTGNIKFIFANNENKLLLFSNFKSVVFVKSVTQIKKLFKLF